MSKHWLTKVSVAVLSLCGPALGFAAEGAMPAHEKAMPTHEKAISVTEKSSHLKWGACPPIFTQGCEVAVLHGNPAKKNADVFLKVAPNTVLPHHLHTSAERMILVRGELKVTYDGQQPVVMKPGAYAYGPAKLPHTAECTGKGTCVLFIAFEQPVDAIAAEGGAEAPAAAMPAEKGAMPAEAPADKGAMPADKGAMPADKGAMPADKGTMPAEKDAMPAPGAPTEKPGETPASKPVENPAGKSDK